MTMYIPLFNPADCYWIVAGDTTRVYASARQIYVLVADAVYTAWLAANNLPSRIGTEADLWNALTFYGVSHP